MCDNERSEHTKLGGVLRVLFIALLGGGIQLIKLIFATNIKATPNILRRTQICEQKRLIKFDTQKQIRKHRVQEKMPKIRVSGQIGVSLTRDGVATNTENQF